MKKLLAGCYAALLVLAVAAPAAYAAAPPAYQSSEPSDGDTMHEPPDRVEATFDQPLDPSSALMVTDACGHRIDDRTTEVSGNSMSVGLEEKPSGEYTVTYLARGIAGVTGATQGRFTFTAHAGKSCGPGAAKHDHDGNDDDHEGHTGGSDDHSGTHDGSGDHDPGTEHTAGHAAGSSDHIDHAAGSTTDHEAHAAGSEDDKHADHAGGHERNDLAAGGFDGITSSDTARNLIERADSGTLLVALGLCLLLGVLGGAVLRTTGAR
jgi:methionine-rich copper-binding protein CopC